MSQIKVQLEKVVPSTGGIFTSGGSLFYDDRLEARVAISPTAASYRSQLPDRRPVIVKVPHRAAGIAALEREYNVLDRLWQRIHQREPHAHVALPPVAWGWRDEDPGQPVLVQQFYDAPLALPSMPSTDEIIQTELVLVDAGIDFCRVMMALRDLRLTCVTHQPGDLWTDHRSRLVIANWNALTPPEAAFYAAELHVFARLWRTLLTGRADRPPYDPLDDDAWMPPGSRRQGGAASIGLRVILAAAAHPNRLYRFVDESGQSSHDDSMQPSFRLLRRSLGSWRDLLARDDLAAQSLDDLGQDIVRLLSHPDAVGAILGEQVDAVAADLLWRAGGFGPEGWQARERVRRSPHDIPNPNVRRLNELVTAGQVAEISSLVDMQIITHRDNTLEAQHLRRWQVVAEVLQQAAEAGLPQAPYRKALARVGTLLHADPHHDRAESLAAAEQLLDDLPASTGEAAGATEAAGAAEDGDADAETVPALAPLRHEIRLRLNALQQYRPALSPFERRQLLRAQADHIAGAPHLHDPGGAEFDADTLLRRMFDGFLVNDLIDRLEQDDRAGVDAIYYLSLALADGENADWLSRALDPLRRYLTFVQQGTDQDWSTVSLAAILDEAEAISRLPAMQAHPAFAPPLDRVVLTQTDAAYRRIVAANEQVRWYALRGTARVCDELVALRPRLEAVIGRAPADCAELSLVADWDTLENVTQEHRNLRSFFDEWLAQGYEHQLRRLTTEEELIVADAVAFLNRALTFIDRSKEIGVSMDEIFGDQEGARAAWQAEVTAALRAIRDFGERAANLPALLEKQHREVSDMVSDVERQITSVEVQLRGLDATSVRQAAFDETLAGVDQAIQALQTRLEAADEALTTLEAGLTTTQGQIVETRRGVTDGFDRFNQIRTDLERQLRLEHDRLEHLFNQRLVLLQNEKTALRAHILQLAHSEPANDAARHELIDELIAVMRQCSGDAFPGVFSDWVDALRTHVELLKVVRPQLKKQRRLADEPEEGVPAPTPLETLGELLVPARRKDPAIDTILYWIDFAERKANPPAAPGNSSEGGAP